MLLLRGFPVPSLPPSPFPPPLPYRQEDFIEGQKDDWRYIGIVIDRLFFWVFSLVILLGTMACLLNAPALYDTTIPVEQLVRDELRNKENV